MKISSIAFIFFSVCFVATQSFAQDADKPKTVKKYEFQKFHNNRIKKLKQGRYLDVYLNSNDTTHTQNGDLIDLNDSVLTIEMSSESFSVETDNHSFSEDFYSKDTIIHIPINTIKHLRYEAKGTLIGPVTSSVSLFTALILAPLISIDRSQPNNFNSKRYTTVVIPALIGAGVGLTLSFTIGFNTKLKIKTTQ
jgi:hypothetical protein